MRDFEVLVTHVGDRLYRKGETRSLDNDFFIAELLGNGIVRVKPEPEKTKQAKKQNKPT